jgi:hypothetical protein
VAAQRAGGRDVGTNRALAALARDVIPTDSAAKMAIAEVPTGADARRRSTTLSR